MKALKMLVWIPITITALYLMIMFYIYFNQDKMVFYPTDEIAALPNQIGLSFEDILIPTEDSVILHGWFFPQADTVDKKVVILCHGNAGNISHRLATAKFLTDLGMAVLLFDYRGYGKSTGEPTEEGVYVDSETCYKWLRDTKNFAEQNIFIFGRSLGGAVGVELAARVKSGGLIIESSFTTVGDMGQKLFPFFPIKKLIRYKFDSINKISDLSCPVVVTHSPDDELIPYQMGEKLFAKASQPKSFVKISGGHNDREYFNDESYRHALKGLFQIE